MHAPDVVKKRERQTSERAMAGYCTRCGKGYPPDAAYCPSCGHQLWINGAPRRSYGVLAAVAVLLAAAAVAAPFAYQSIRHARKQAAADSAVAPVSPDAAAANVTPPPPTPRVAKSKDPVDGETASLITLLAPGDGEGGADIAPPASLRPSASSSADQDPQPPAFANLSPDLAGDIDPKQFDALSADGTWQQGDNGRTWQPDPAEVGGDFEPYATQGQWSLSDLGWVFVSDFAWGWATFHYGQWTVDGNRGWVWSPGTKWAPAQVKWVEANPPQSAAMVGWQPLAPRATKLPATVNGMPTWHFVAASDLNLTNIRQHTVSAADLPALLQQSKPAPIAYRGPSLDFFHAAEVPIQPQPIDRLDHTIRPPPPPPAAKMVEIAPVRPIEAEVHAAAKPEPEAAAAPIAPAAETRGHRHEWPSSDSSFSAVRPERENRPAIAEPAPAPARTEIFAPRAEPAPSSIRGGGGGRRR